MKKIFNENLLSVDEFKTSSLVLSLFICIIVCIIAFFTTGTVDNGLLDLTLGLVYSVAGINVVKGASNLITTRSTSSTNTTSSVTRDSGSSEDNKGDYKV